MAKKSGRKKQKKSGEKDQNRSAYNDPWLGQRTGLLIMGLASLVLAVLVVWETQSAVGMGQALIWGIGFGLSLWAVFLLFYVFNRWIRRR